MLHTEREVDDGGDIAEVLRGGFEKGDGGHTGFGFSANLFDFEDHFRRAYEGTLSIVHICSVCVSGEPPQRDIVTARRVGDELRRERKTERLVISLKSGIQAISQLL